MNAERYGGKIRRYGGTEVRRRPRAGGDPAVRHPLEGGDPEELVAQARAIENSRLRLECEVPHCPLALFGASLGMTPAPH